VTAASHSRKPFSGAIESPDGEGHAFLIEWPYQDEVTISLHGEPTNGVVRLRREDLLEALGVTEAEPEPEWMDAKVVQATLDAEPVFAERDMDGDWLIYGGGCNGDVLTSLEVRDEFSDVQIIA